MTGYGAPLPGLEPPTPAPGPLTAAALETIGALKAAGLIEARHRLTCVLIERLSRAVDAGLDAPKVSVATATLSKHLLEAIDSLPQPAAAGGDIWDDFQRKLEAAAA